MPDSQSGTPHPPYGEQAFPKAALGEGELATLLRSDHDRLLVLEQQIQFERAQRSADFLELKALQAARVEMLLELRVLKGQLVVWATLGAIIGGVLVHFVTDIITKFFGV